MKIEVRYDDAAAREAMRKSPGIVTNRLNEALGRGAGEIGRQARANVKGIGKGTLVQSIISRMVAPLHFVVSTGTAYARIVEEGSGPAAGKAKYYPNPDALKDWLMTTPSYRGHGWARAGTTKRGNQELDIWLRSRAMAWGIYQKGTKAYPFMKPAVEDKRARVIELANLAMRQAVAEINGGGHAA